MEIDNAKTRFTNRVEDYRKHRPTYPAEVLAGVRQQCALSVDAVVADIGAGTGISSQLLLRELPCQVVAVEPNAAMRQAAQEMLGAAPRFHANPGSAEATGLPDKSVDLAAAFQAFHWFAVTETQREFRRILKPPGWVLLVWNERLAEQPGFQADYEQILRQLPDYVRTCHSNIKPADIAHSLGTSEIVTHTVEHAQFFDWPGLAGRFLSSSYAPQPGAEGHDSCLSRLRALFDRCQEQGQVAFRYRAVSYLAKMAG